MKDKPKKNTPTLNDAGRKSQWKPGNSGNPNGVKKISGPSLTRRIIKYLDTEKQDGKTLADLVAEKLVNEAIEGGDFRFLKELLDRVDGRPTEHIETRTIDERLPRDLNETDMVRLMSLLPDLDYLDDSADSVDDFTDD